jgi:hypothetical protein
MAIDLTKISEFNKSMNEFMSHNIQFKEDISTNLGRISEIENEFMTLYAKVSTQDITMIDKCVDILKEWKSTLKDLLLEAPSKVVSSSFEITEGVKNSHNQPYLTYAISSGEIVINVAGYSNDLLIFNPPALEWSDNSPVQLVSDEWIGLGTRRIVNTIEEFNEYDKITGTINFECRNLQDPVTTTTKFLLDTSVDQPYVTFNSSTGKLILNFNVFVNTPHVNKIPKLTWLGDTTSDREAATLLVDWVGLGTYSASCTIDMTDHGDSVGSLTETLEGVVELSYEPGSSEAWSLRYDWVDYQSLSTTIQSSLNQSLPQTTSTYVTYVENVNSSLANIVALESEIEQNYAIASASDLPIIDHMLGTLTNWKNLLIHSIDSLNVMYPSIRTS